MPLWFFQTLPIVKEFILVRVTRIITQKRVVFWKLHTIRKMISTCQNFIFTISCQPKSSCRKESSFFFFFAVQKKRLMEKKDTISLEISWLIRMWNMGWTIQSQAQLHKRQNLYRTPRKPKRKFHITPWTWTHLVMAVCPKILMPIPTNNTLTNAMWRKDLN